MTTFAADMRELMAAWNKIIAAAKAQFAGASDEEIFGIASSAMNRALGLKPPVVKPAPAKVPRIYPALQFTPSTDGKSFTYAQVQVAACSQAEAVNTMRLGGVKGEVYVLTDEAVERGPVTVWNTGSDPFDPVSHEDHMRWVRIQTRGHWESGTYYGPTYTRVYLGPVDDPKPSINHA